MSGICRTQSIVPCAEGDRRSSEGRVDLGIMIKKMTIKKMTIKKDKDKEDD